MSTVPTFNEKQDDLVAVHELDAHRNVTKVEEVEQISYNFTPAEERALVRKLDWHILPFVWLCYLFNSLDRSNVSNAKSDGMTSESLRFSCRTSPTPPLGFVLMV